MLVSNIHLKPGMPLSSPAGRRLEVGEVFVPRHNRDRSRRLPASFRNLGRKVVVFKDGSIAPLADVRRRFKTLSH